MDGWEGEVGKATALTYLHAHTLHRHTVTDIHNAPAAYARS